MTERELRALAAYLDLPAERDLGPAVRARLEPRRRPARALVLVLAFAVVALAVAFAVPPARSAILRVLHLQGATIEFVDRLPEVTTTAPLELGTPVPLADTARTAGFRPLQSTLLGSPDRIAWDGTMLWFSYGRVRLLVSQFRGTERIDLVKKLVEPRTMVTPVSIGGRSGYFMTGARHFLYLAPTGTVHEERIRLAGNVLLWQRGPLTLRLEGDVTLPEALRIARSFR